MNFFNTFRMNNIEHSQMIRLMLVTFLYDTPGANEVFSRMTDISYKLYLTMLNYYSAESAEQMYNLITQNYIIIRNLASALKERNDVTSTTLLQHLQQNSDDISDLFSRINPYWSRFYWQNLMDRYIRLMYQEILALINENCKLALDIFDRITALMILMGDYMASGIIWSLKGEVPQP